MSYINFEEKYLNLKKIINTGKINDYIFNGLYKGGNINICNIKGLTFSIQVCYKDTIHTVMDQIKHIKNIPIHKQVLKFGTTVLESHRTLYHYKIPIEGILYLIINKDKYNPTARDKWAAKILKQINKDQFEINIQTQKIIENRMYL